ncbi:Oidioi.mRNA.OKI2018_I69.XSR.g16535.t1.cds [Oikopleura dioica]|uniref:Oidioi.mRNA.OKI2018_I69.XSR.g16535.t1.cds n=1 Tax=Oikopleura dioica TaxID=34765 RepID=A0ABN7SGW3_OIKDI|nr:Oidioi.mRNA.OKI2018_I69.XSR.g16535.t1.cds [Oikopleura dioica]
MRLLRPLWCILSSIFAADPFVVEVGREPRANSRDAITALADRLLEAENNIAKISNNQKQQTTDLNNFHYQKNENEVRLINLEKNLQSLESGLQTCLEAGKSNRNAQESLRKLIRNKFKGESTRTKMINNKINRLETKDDFMSVLAELENRVEMIENYREKVLKPEITENLRKMEIKIEQVEENISSIPQTSSTQNNEVNNGKYQAMRDRLSQLEGTQNSIKVNYEKLIEQSKYMSEGYAQKFYVSKELSRLNDTLTREINEVKFSMAQMDDCCLRKDPSEAEPVAADYLYDEKFSDIDDKIRDIYERINFRFNNAESTHSHSYLEGVIQKLEDDLNETVQNVFRNRTLLNNKINQNSLQIVAQQKNIDDMKDRDLQREKMLSMLQFDMSQIRSTTESNSLKFQNQITSLDHENTNLRNQYRENYSKLVSLNSKLNYADNYADEFSELEKLSRDAIIQASTLKSQVGVFQNRLSDMNLTMFTHLYAHDKTVDSVSRDIQQMKSRLEQQKDSLSSTIQEVQVEQGELSDKLRALTSRIADGFSLNEEEVARIQQSMHHLATNTNFASDSDEITILKSNLNQVQVTLSAQGSSIQDIKNEQNTILERVLLVETSDSDDSAPDLRMNTTIFAKEVELKADARVVYDDFAAKYLEIVDSLRDLNVRNSQIQQMLSTVQESRQSTSYNAVLDKIDSLDSAISSLNSTTEDLYDKIEELETNTTEKLYRLEDTISPRFSNHRSMVPSAELQQLQNIVERHSRRINEIFVKVSSETASADDLEDLRDAVSDSDLSDTVQELASTLTRLQSEMLVGNDLERLSTRVKGIQDKFHRFQSTNRLAMSDLKRAVENAKNERGGISNANGDNDDDFNSSPGVASKLRRLGITVSNLSNKQKRIIEGFNNQSKFLKEGLDRIGELENSCCTAGDIDSDYTDYDSPSSSSSSSSSSN